MSDRKTPRYASDLMAGQVALVTGSGSGMGRATALEMASCGARLALFARREEPLEETAEMIRTAGGEAFVVPGDTRDEASIETAMGRIKEHYGQLDVLVNNAGVAMPGDFLETTLEQFQKVIDINLTGTFIALQRAAKGMVANKIEGSIVNMSSINAIVAIPSIAAYCASKGGVMQLTKASSLALAPHNIRVNAVGPGSIDTAMLAGVNSNPEAMANVMSRTPLKRLGTAREIGDIVAFLASEKASYITGETINADGGRLGMNYTC